MKQCFLSSLFFHLRQPRANCVEGLQTPNLLCKVNKYRYLTLIHPIDLLSKLFLFSCDRKLELK